MAFYFDSHVLYEQQYSVVQWAFFSWVGLEFWLTGKLGRAWVGAWVGDVVMICWVGFKYSVMHSIYQTMLF